jgi:hypothetical protein
VEFGPSARGQCAGHDDDIEHPFVGEQPNDETSVAVLTQPPGRPSRSMDRYNRAAGCPYADIVLR